LNPIYPAAVRRRLGMDCPGVIWAKGDISLLNRPAVAVIGSRDLYEDNLLFAEEAGRQAALQGYVLVSGNARGADQIAQDACLAAGGCVISVVADELEKKPLMSRMLWLSLDGFDQSFSTIRALSRNHVIHSLGDMTLVAQCTMGKGGTWDGTVKNLQCGYSPVCCFDDGSDAVTELVNRGAVAVTAEDLRDLQALKGTELNFMGQ
jgi:predicted Rossmann fold nucleotide-binding protein DprA/Smf involved in DNA uptake